jgi:DNA-binding NarL/FixJ family response regulator
MIFITAFPEERIQQQTMNAGAIGYLTKPFDESQLFECVEQALMKGRGTPDQGLHILRGVCDFRHWGPQMGTRKLGIWGRVRPAQ